MPKFKICFLGLVFVAIVSGCLSGEFRIKSIYDGDKQMWDRIFDSSPAYKFESAPFGVILPHHMIVGDEIAKFYNGLSEVSDPSVVVVIGPNHYQNGSANIQTCENCVYDTVAGDLSLDLDLISQMLDYGLAESNPDTFLNEHSIYHHAPFVKKFFPNAVFVPVVLKWETTFEEVQDLADWLNENLPENSLVIASVDFSHYISADAADFHDISSYSTIKNFDYANVYDHEVDSSPSLLAIMKLMENREYMSVVRLNHTNNQDYHEEILDSTTSHQFIAFYGGELIPEKALTIMTFDNVKAGFYDNYRWDINSSENGISPDLNGIAGVEDRFLVGADFLVFDLPNGCTVREQNFLKISFCKLAEGEDLPEEVKDSDYVYVLYEFSDSEFSDADREIAQEFVKNGVDVFVGRGLSGSLTIERIGDAVIAYSLSNDSGGIVLGVALGADGPRVFEFP